MKKYKKNYLLIFFLIIIIIFLGIYLFSKLYEDNKQKYYKKYEYLTTFNQLLIPEAHSFFLRGYEYNIFGEYEYILNLWNGYNNNDKKIKNKLNNNYIISDYTLEDLNIYSQNFYKTTTPKKIDKLYPGEYIYYLSLKEPMELQQLFNIMKTYMEENISNCGLLWIPINTSNDDNDICIGLRGNLKTMTPYRFKDDSIYLKKFFSNDTFYFSEQIKFVKQLNILFENSTLIDNISIEDKNFQINTNTTTKNNDINLNIENRLNFVYKNGVKALGIVFYADENFINEEIFSYFNLIKINNIS